MTKNEWTIRERKSWTRRVFHYSNLLWLTLDICVLADFDDAQEDFEALAKLDPNRLDDMDVYSNVLYVKVTYPCFCQSWWWSSSSSSRFHFISSLSINLSVYQSIYLCLVDCLVDWLFVCLGVDKPFATALFFVRNAKPSWVDSRTLVSNWISIAPKRVVWLVTITV